MKIEARLYKDGEIVRFRDMTMVVMEAYQALKGWRYKLGFPTKSGLPHKTRTPWFAWQSELISTTLTPESFNN